jgi:hypothetical protein
MLGRKTHSQASAFEAECFGSLVALEAVLRQSQHMANATADLRPQIKASLSQRRQSAQSHR